MVARFCVGNVEGDVPAAWEDGAQLVAAAPPDGDRVRAAFSIRRHVTDGDLNALVDQVTPRGAREVSRASKTVIGRHAIALEIEIAPPGGEAVFEHTLWVASSGSGSVGGAGRSMALTIIVPVMAKNGSSQGNAEDSV